MLYPKTNLFTGATPPSALGWALDDLRRWLRRRLRLCLRLRLRRRLGFRLRLRLRLRARISLQSIDDAVRLVWDLDNAKKRFAV